MASALLKDMLKQNTKLDSQDGAIIMMPKCKSAVEFGWRTPSVYGVHRPDRAGLDVLLLRSCPKLRRWIGFGRPGIAVYSRKPLKQHMAWIRLWSLLWLMWGVGGDSADGVHREKHSIRRLKTTALWRMWRMWRIECIVR